ncbi:DNA repair protein RadA [Alicyclobacillus cellulosilyticus]|uniref:DNA repair protein RadA n=1 Tax=Alicyclobacillus cellulosilyticus TaxID=1003997 RepID=A0A917K7T6_9BACL|nr:DNA repair protein RadA [Alicyclobacillus cellulosilyticus]GGJ01308.1 DNA repair protein RadA [Alicyclobacillus cellulosilyticus]
MSRTRTRFVCQQCGHEAVKWHGRCPQCGAWNAMVEELVASRRPQDRPPAAEAVALAHVPMDAEPRLATGIAECDRVLGGGLVPGSLVLIGGDPGIGKSTLLLQISDGLARAGRRVLYVSAEESLRQVRMRAERLGALHPNVWVVAETNLDAALAAAERLHPHLLVIDSIQTVYLTDLGSAPGSVSQVRECTARLLQTCKPRDWATFIVGHVTKDGQLAGPRMLEHMVDAVLYFEGERHHAYRMLRAVKNRFGSTHEMAIFEMHGDGLEPVLNPSERFLAERSVEAPGSAVVTAMEGTRPLLLEVQALVAPTSFATPRRMVTGADANRCNLILAVLERRLGVPLQAADTYINLAGGVRVDEPAIDLGVAVALVSSTRNRPVPPGDVFVGEVGLTGEVRTVSRIEQRIREAEKLGFTRCIVPAHSVEAGRWTAGMEVVGVRTVAEALRLAF